MSDPKIKMYIFVSISVITLIFTIIIQLSYIKKFTDFISEDYLNSNPIVRVEKINDDEFIELNVSESVQKEIINLLKDLVVKIDGPERLYTRDDADYMIYSNSNRDFRIFVLVDEELLVFPEETLRGYYVINNEDFFEKLGNLLQ
ncbi:hypothetical protein ACOQFO_02795 [Ureibacillus sp. MALMAid1270]|uniref:hypothetical protein n=1 Tax=Ureibacillus sp. MALMAid1270 TaxID=3411629 RepID=UPI003BA43532